MQRKRTRIWLTGIIVISICIAFNNISHAIASKNKAAQLHKETNNMKSVQEYLKDTYKKGMSKVVKSDEEWKKILTPEQFRITRNAGTEPAFCGVFYDNHKKGIYLCICCSLPLFSANAKFDSGTGWPSFFQPINKDHVAEKSDTSYGMRRTEINCARCGAHLGHVFSDGPKPSGLRYCLNSESLTFVEDK